MVVFDFGMLARIGAASLAQWWVPTESDCAALVPWSDLKLLGHSSIRN